MSSADAIERQAAAFLLRRESNSWGAADEAELGAWLRASSAHKATYWRLEYGWERIGRLSILRTPPKGVIRVSRISLIRHALAASFAALLCLGIPLDDRGSDGEILKYETRVGGLKAVRLADGSRVELSSNTFVQAELSGGRRNIWLRRGEAYFEVVHNDKHPFVIHMTDRKVIVLGTKFAVRADGDQVRVVVVQGRVRFEPIGSSGTAPVVELSRGQVAFAHGRDLLVTTEPGDRISALLGWRSGMLNFDRASLSQIAAEFNRYNDTQLVVEDPALGEMRIGGAFEAKNVEAFARLLQSAYALRVHRDANRIIISY